MPAETVAERLTRLDAAPEPLAARFDSGPAFSGRVAVLPAAFNPPTIAHAHLLRLAAGEGDIDAAAALLSTKNVDKGLHGATLEQRVEMLLAMAGGEPFGVLATNQARLADQSAALEQSFPGVDFDFVVGYDTLVRLFDERYYEDMPADLARFFAAHRVMATNRAEHSVADVARFVREHRVAAPHADRILVREVDDEPASYSSSASRGHAAIGADLAQLPALVAAYVREHGLYR